MSIPDYISPIVGFRVWQWDSNGIKSLNGEPWLPHKRLAASCMPFSFRIVSSRTEPAHGGHDAPQMNCTCGIYAAKNLDHLRRKGYAQHGICGEVYLWGTVVEHELGWRAQYACPKNFLLPLEMLPVSISILEPRLKTLTAYGCDIHIIGNEGAVPLWASGSGYEAATLDLLVQRCKSWYARRQQERRIKRGDRVAILGRGIAVVEQVNDRHVLVLLWNRTILRIGRKEIVWDEQNLRWEADPSDVFHAEPVAIGLTCKSRRLVEP